jgi:RNA polymerase sigma-70 factor (ECF subfamily)
MDNSTARSGVLSDGDTIGRSISNPAIFVNVFDRHGAAVHSYLARRAGQQTAEDLAGDVWLAAFNARRRFDTTVADALPWLFGIARNVLRSHWRVPGTGPLSPFEPVHDPWPEVDDRLDAGCRRSVLRAALSTLAPVDREVLLLNAWEQLTPAEIAQAGIGRSASTCLEQGMACKLMQSKAGADLMKSVSCRSGCGNPRD